MRLDDPRATLLNQPDTFGPGVVAIICGELGRFSAFWFHAFNVHYALPEGSIVTGRIGSDITGARNDLIRDFLDSPGEWIWFIDDDHTFEHEVVMKLLAHNVDIVTPLCLRRQSPFLPVPTVDDDFLDLRKYQSGELVEVQFAGSSGMLIRRKVLEAISTDGAPWSQWFELSYDSGPDGESRRISEDVTFCQRASHEGFKIHIDTGVTMSHMTTASVEPVWDEKQGVWMTGITLANGYTVYTGSVPPEQVAAEQPEPVEAQ